MTATNKLTYEEFLQRVADRLGGEASETDSFLHCLGPLLERTLKSEGHVNLSGFGRFDLHRMEASAGHDPRSGEAMAIAAHTRVHFVPFKALKVAVNWPYRGRKVRLLAREQPRAWHLDGFIWALWVAIVLVLVILFFTIPSDWRSDTEALPAAAVATQVAEPTQQLATAAAPAPVVAPTPTTLEHHVAVAGDTLWQISAQRWNAPRWWPLIYTENRARMVGNNPDRLAVGADIRIPALQGTAQSPTERDLQRLTESYTQVGLDYRRNGNANADAFTRAAQRGLRL